MKDRFKFRVWDKSRNKFIESPEPTPMLQTNGLLAYFKDEKYMNNYDIKFCTGLKDKNGKLIYEGDIVEDVLMNKFVVSFNKNYLSFLLTNIKNEQSMVFYPNINIEVIGNIYENPELLQECE